MDVRYLHVGTQISGGTHLCPTCDSGHLRDRQLVCGPGGGLARFQEMPNNITHLPRVNSPTRGVIDEERNAVRADGPQGVV